MWNPPSVEKQHEELTNEYSSLLDDYNEKIKSGEKGEQDLKNVEKKKEELITFRKKWGFKNTDPEDPGFILPPPKNEGEAFKNSFHKN